MTVCTIPRAWESNVCTSPMTKAAGVPHRGDKQILLCARPPQRMAMVTVMGSPIIETHR